MKVLMKHPGMRGRRGSLYIAVLMTTVIVSVATLAGLIVFDVRTSTTADGIDAWRARSIADSAIAAALAELNADPDWQTNYQHGVPTQPASWMEGQFRYMLTNQAADLENLGDGQFTLTAFGSSGRANAAKQITLAAKMTPVESLDKAIYVSNDLEVNGGSLGSISTDGKLRVQDEITSGADRIFAEEIQQTGEPDPLGGTATSNWYDYYVNNGTEIPRSVLPRERLLGLITVGHRLENIVLSANHNPFGAANPNGIYYIRGDGLYVDIRDCRISATLVLLDVGWFSSLRGNLHMAPHNPDLPALMVDGAINHRALAGTLSEAALGVNFNPAHTPYRGQADTTLTGEYPSRIEGIVYTDRNYVVHAGSSMPISGKLIVGGSLTVNSPLVVINSSPFLTQAPPGFQRIDGIEAKPGTYRSVSSDWSP
ncbi:hypothetical protein SH139x_003515 [Planctomycetaceae bacterium SH139]